MAGIRPVLGAIARVSWRELRALQSLSANNFFLFTMLLLVKQPESAYFPQLILGLLLFFPLSTDPMRKVPDERLQVLPIGPGDRIRLHVLSVFLSPVFWVLTGVAIYGGVRFRLLTVQFFAVAIAANLLAIWVGGILQRVPRLNILRDIPAFPGGMGALVRKNIREQLCLLDTYVAVILSLLGTFFVYRSPVPQPAMKFGVTMLSVLALSTCAQRLFALDAGQGLMRYRLLPLSGWRILLAKDIAFLAAVAICAAPLAPFAGLSAGLAALTIGHHAAVLYPIPQRQWRFTAGASFTHGVLQIIALFGVGAMTFRGSTLAPLCCAAAWLVSLFWFGWQFDRRRG
ncbi:MAG: hypothetical protein HYZ37_16085 [Candidatus Solibacter usitatus]|nr:hypothetical protein [Candidatus Solibacter usitatus]